MEHFIVSTMRLFDRIKQIARLTDHIDTQSAQASIIANIDFKGPNVWILAFAIIIASVGLNVNSIPVIIGAMLISPLMGPIMGIGLALGINDTKLLKKAFTNLLIMTGISITASTVFFLISPLSLEEPTELLARTNPTIYDVFIALFGGFAVIVEICRKDKGTVIAGAAIATALMPPLCTAGYGIATGSFAYFMGACYLYFINSVFIALATFLTVRTLHFPIVHFSDPEKQKKVHRVITIFTIVLIIPSIYSAFMVIKENNFNQIAKTFVLQNKNLGNSYIYDYSTRHSGHKPSVITISIAGEALSERDIEQLHQKLVHFGITPQQLEINQAGTFVTDNSADKEMIKTIFEQNEQEILKREKLIAQMEAQLKEFNSKKFPSLQITKELLAQYPQISSLILARGEKVESAQLSAAGDVSPQEHILAIIRTTAPLEDGDITKLEKWLAIRLDVAKVEIITEE